MKTVIGKALVEVLVERSVERLVELLQSFIWRLVRAFIELLQNSV